MKLTLRLSIVLLASMTSTVLLAAQQADVAVRLTKIATVPEDLPEAVRTELNQRRMRLDTVRSKIKQQVEEINALPSVPRGSAEAARRLRELQRLAREAEGCSAAVRQFNADVEAKSEQGLFQASRQAWVTAMRSLMITSSVARTKALTAEIMEALTTTKGQVALAKLPKTLEDLAPGDVLLMAPDVDSRASRAIPSLDQEYRAISAFYSDDPKIRHKDGHPIAHTVLFLRTVKGTRLYLDHQLDEGTRVINEREFQARYARRLSHVAIPQVAVDGEQLWSAAKKAALHSTKRDYGIGGNALVCSEKDTAILVFAYGGRLDSIYEMVGGKGGLIEMTPSDFFHERLQGEYFVVAPLKASKSP